MAESRSSNVLGALAIAIALASVGCGQADGDLNGGATTVRSIVVDQGGSGGAENGAADSGTSNPADDSDVQIITGDFVGLDDLAGLSADGQIIDGEALAGSIPDGSVAPVQREALSDGELSLEEFTELVRTELDCVREAGLRPTPISIVAVQFGVEIPTYSFTDPTDSSADSEGPLRQTECQQQYSALYQMLYVKANSPSAEEQQQLLVAEAQEFVACARAEGLEPPVDVVTRQSLDEVFRWYDQVSVETSCPLEP
jgi:hypothetical protein